MVLETPWNPLFGKTKLGTIRLLFHRNRVLECSVGDHVHSWIETPSSLRVGDASLLKRCNLNGVAQGGSSLPWFL